MRADFLLEHASLHRVTRRDFVELTMKAGAAGALAGLGLDVENATAGPVSSEDGGRKAPLGRFADEMFDVEAVLNGAWDGTAFYRRGDQRGTLQEVTPHKTREALKVLDGAKPVLTYNLGEVMFNGFPAFPSTPPRLYNQRLLVLGYEPPPGYDGILQSPTPMARTRSVPMRSGSKSQSGQAPTRTATRSGRSSTTTSASGRCTTAATEAPTSPRPGARAGSETNTQARS
jgi:hypothetical protein